VAVSGTDSTRHWELWALRLSWLAVPLFVGPGLRRALDSLTSTPGLILEVALWTVWFAGLVACLTPNPVSLTAVRILAPATAGFAVIAAVRVGLKPAVVAAFGYGLVVTALALLPSIGDRMVNGSAYGSERRMALRTPAVAFLGPIPLAWMMVFVGLVGWAVLAAAGLYWLAVPAALVGAAAVWAGFRLLHQLAVRWIVFVPAGFVIHDPFQLLDPVLVARAKIRRLGPAEISDLNQVFDRDRAGDEAEHPGPPADTEPVTLDLSAGSLGLALEVESTEALLFSVRSRNRVEGKKSSKVVFSPTLPGAVLSEARIRGIRIRGSSGVD